MRFLSLVLALLFSASSVAACGADTDCKIGERHYRIAMPKEHDGAEPVPVVVFAHGYRGSAKGVMRNGSLRRLASDMGAALIAVKSVGPGWDLPNAPRNMQSDGAAEFSYFLAVLEDAEERFALDETRIVVTGFSGGGMMTWNLACARPEQYAAFVPIAGTFWLEPPDTCAQPVKSLIHIHGDVDKTVPLLGRPIASTKQGEVPEALQMYEVAGNFGPPDQQKYDDLTCNEQTNSEGAVLHFCLFSGGHSFRTEHLKHALDKLGQAGLL